MLPLQDGETVVYVAENLLSILSCFRVSVPGGVAVGGSLHEVNTPIAYAGPIQAIGASYTCYSYSILKNSCFHPISSSWQHNDWGTSSQV